ncbi:hypothetical protein [Sorangium sp. So ce1153]|uniref:hypothetical protein n=1 Tax=Sorangium sp. So ce1153 TaxID=3133333 RepID=UPI003F5F0BE8
MRSRSVRSLCLSAALVALWISRAVPALAQAGEALPPWHRGVSEERKQRARALFHEGRELHQQLMLGDARARYEEALRSWEHPELRFNLARALWRMGQPLSAYENLRLSLRWGPGALAAEGEKQALDLMRRLEEQELSAVEIRCDEPGASVQLDGKPWFVGPGHERRTVLPGEHVIVARKKGYFPVVKSAPALAGRRVSGTLKLSVDGIVTERRWAAGWAPWAVVGSGAAVVALGGALQWRVGELRDELQQQCGVSCAPASAQDAGAWEGRVAAGAFVAGGVTVATGLVLVWLNRPRAYRSEDRGGLELQLSPLVSRERGALSARLSF